MRRATPPWAVSPLSTVRPVPPGTATMGRRQPPPPRLRRDESAWPRSVTSATRPGLPGGSGKSGAGSPHSKTWRRIGRAEKVVALFGGPQPLWGGTARDRRSPSATVGAGGLAGDGLDGKGLVPTRLQNRQRCGLRLRLRLRTGMSALRPVHFPPCFLLAPQGQPAQIPLVRPLWRQMNGNGRWISSRLCAANRGRPARLPGRRKNKSPQPPQPGEQPILAI